MKEIPQLKNVPIFKGYEFMKVLHKSHKDKNKLMKELKKALLKDQSREIK